MENMLVKCLEGDKQAWDAFVDRYAAVIFSAVLRVIKDRGIPSETETAEDVAQEVFLRLVRDDFHLLRTYDPSRASLVTWLTIVARSNAIDFLRHKRLPSVSLEKVPPIEAALPVNGASSLGESKTATGDLPLGILTARQRLVLKLLFDKEINIAEIAQLLGVSAQTVRSTKHKAIERLRKYFGAKNS